MHHPHTPSANSFTTYDQWTEYCNTLTTTILNDIRLLKLQFLSTGTYYLDYINVHGSSYICLPVEVNEIINDDINIFPNPSSGIININDLNSDFTLLSITNINGFIIKTLPIKSLKISLLIQTKWQKECIYYSLQIKQG